MKKMILIILLIFSFTFQSLALIDIDIEVDGNKKVDIKIESRYEKKPITIVVFDNDRKHYIDQDVTFKDGSAEFHFKLEEDKEYEAKVNIDGRQKKFFIFTEETLPEGTVKIYIEGYEGVILPKREVKFEEGDRVLDILERILKKEDIEYHIKNGYVKSIDGQAEFDKGAKSGWMFSINGEFPEIGARSVEVEDGDYIRWLYTENLGEDIASLDPTIIYFKDEVEEALEKAQKILKSPEASEKDIVKAINDIMDILNDNFSNIKNDEDAETLIYYVDEVFEILEKSVEKIQSQKYQGKTVHILVDLSKYLMEFLDVVENEDIKNEAKDSISKMASILLLITAKTEDIEELEDSFDGIIESLLKGINELEEEKLHIEISLEGKEGIELNFPKGLLKDIFKTDIDEIEIQTKIASINIGSNILDNKLIGKEILIKIDDESNGFQNIVDISIIADGKEIYSLNKPIEVSIPYGDKEQGPWDGEIFLLKEDGRKETITGKYDRVTKSLKFTTDHLGKYMIELWNKGFSDLDNHNWAKKAIEVMVGQGIVKGRTDEKFDPNAKITRAEFAALIIRMIGYDTDNDTVLPFEDVDKDSWYYNPVAAAYEKGLINGRKGVIFDPDGNITRQEMAKIIAKVLENKSFRIEEDMKLDIFKDEDDIDLWAKYSAALAAKEGIITGMEDGSFAPKEKATRAQAAVMLYRLYNLLKDL